MEVSGQLHTLAALPSTPPRERAPGTHWLGSWVVPKATLGMAGKIKISYPCSGIKPWFLSCPVHSPLLYQLSYPISWSLYGKKIFCDVKRFTVNCVLHSSEVLLLFLGVWIWKGLEKYESINLSWYLHPACVLAVCWVTLSVQYPLY
jgi:hypothetical protein